MCISGVSMDGSNWVAILSVVATATASGYATYSQFEANETQQSHILKLEQYKQQNQIEVLKANAKIARFDHYCSQLESAIKKTIVLNIETDVFEDDIDKVFKNRMLALSNMYLLSTEGQNYVRKSLKDMPKLINAVFDQLTAEYGVCK
jgi:hypothetical protein